MKLDPVDLRRAALTAHRAGVCDDVVPGSKHQPARTASSRNEPLRFVGPLGAGCQPVGSSHTEPEEVPGGLEHQLSGGSGPNTSQS